MFRAAVLLNIVGFLLYISLFSFFVYDAPSPGAREVRGFLYQLCLA
jgi:hypothetical protein